MHFNLHVVKCKLITTFNYLFSRFSATSSNCYFLSLLSMFIRLLTFISHIKIIIQIYEAKHSAVITCIKYLYLESKLQCIMNLT